MATLINCKIENFIEKQYVAEQKIEQAIIGSSERTDTLPECDMGMAALAKYIPEPDRVADIAAQLVTVQNATDFKAVLSQIMDMYRPTDLAIISSKPFREALRPFMPRYNPEDDTLYRHCRDVISRK